MPKSPDDLALRDRVVAAIRLNRELIEHLDQGFVPKVHQLRRLTRPPRPGDEIPGDKAVHAQAASVLESDNFALRVYADLIAHCESIRKSVQELTSRRR
jgi:hypothetical protein